jgi:hypothetical protein
MERLILRFQRKCKRIRGAKANLNKKSKVIEFMLIDFNKVIAINTAIMVEERHQINTTEEGIRNRFTCVRSIDF